LGEPLTLTPIGTDPALLVIATMAGGGDGQKNGTLKFTELEDAAKVGGGVTVMLTGTFTVCAPRAEIATVPVYVPMGRPAGSAFTSNGGKEFGG
jgi:hypothetical protein